MKFVSLCDSRNLQLHISHSYVADVFSVARLYHQMRISHMCTIQCGVKYKNEIDYKQESREGCGAHSLHCKKYTSHSWNLCLFGVSLLFRPFSYFAFSLTRLFFFLLVLLLPFRIFFIFRVPFKFLHSLPLTHFSRQLDSLTLHECIFYRILYSLLFQFSSLMRIMYHFFSSKWKSTIWLSIQLCANVICSRVNLYN